MRRVVFLIVISVFVLNICSAGNDKRAKMLLKECKQVYKKLKSEGWKVYGKPEELDIALSTYYSVLENNDSNIVTIIGMGTANSINVAIRKAMNHATVQYATMKGTKVEGKTKTEESYQVTNGDVLEKESYSMAYNSSVEQSVKSFKPVLSIIRTRNDGVTEAQVYYIVKM